MKFVENIPRYILHLEYNTFLYIHSTQAYLKLMMSKNLSTLLKIEIARIIHNNEKKMCIAAMSNVTRQKNIA